ncbi:hypothetical protein CVT26_003079 [Gymnopilus dilepis]|uniref:Uncharacterized protein n=1 Tax=Gymnopilus dilepis TaxID=231916 RepID=A0A409Y4R3_9AGAR|nr:hypothetical protein CVT26_003079 [Gymnopilus dilepis]
MNPRTLPPISLLRFLQVRLRYAARRLPQSAMTYRQFRQASRGGELEALQPPSVYIFNIGSTKWKQSNDGPLQGETLLQCFINALQGIKVRGYRVQGAMYSPDGANIYIETEDELWDDNINIHTVKDVQEMPRVWRGLGISSLAPSRFCKPRKRLKQTASAVGRDGSPSPRDETPQGSKTPFHYYAAFGMVESQDPSSNVIGSSQSVPADGTDVHTSAYSQPPSIFVFNIGNTRTRQTNDGPWEEESLLECFINALRSIRTKGYKLQGATYSPDGVDIFIDTHDELWDENVDIHMSPSRSNINFSG